MSTFVVYYCIHKEVSASSITTARREYTMPRTKIDRRIVKTKRAISLALFQILAEKNVDDITITELTTKADINRKTFYLHYSCVQDVADELVASMKNVFDHALQSALDEENNFVPAQFFAYLRDKIGEHTELFRAFCLENTSLYFVRALSAPLMESLMNVYRNYSDMSDTSLRAAIIFMAHGALNVYLDWARNPSALTLDEVTEIALRFVEQGTALVATNR